MKDNYNFLLLATDRFGEKIYCKLMLNEKTILKGITNLYEETFKITKYLKHNIPINITKKQIRKQLKIILMQDYNWNLM